MTEATSSLLPVIVRKSRWHDILPLLGSLIVTFIGGYFLTNQKDSWTIEIVTMLFVSSSLYFATQVFNRKPRLIISEDGINVDYWNSAMMPWSDFNKASLKAIGESEYLCLFLADPERFRGRVNLFRRGIHTLTRETGCGDIMINLSNLGLNAGETIALVQRQVELVKIKPKSTSAVKYPSAE